MALLQHIRIWTDRALMTFNAGMRYLRQWWFYVALFLFALYYVKINTYDKFRERRKGIRLSSSGPAKDRQHKEKLQLIRERQQEAAQRAADAAKSSKAKHMQEENRRNAAVAQPQGNQGDGGYNPMQPWTSNKGGRKYLPSPRAMPEGRGRR